MDEKKYINRALKLAKKGVGSVSPNPLVGAVIVKDGRIAGEGYHRYYGGPHAEIDALKAAGNSAKGAVLYCTLEPCSHWGKTPPCSEAIIKAGIKKVVIGMNDPNPRVNGNGIDSLVKSGIEIVNGVSESECRNLNKVYIKYITSGRPYVTLKIAQTLDGKITRRINSRTRITEEKANKFVHRLRTQNDAVLIGKRTAIIDNPDLTPRLSRGNTPVRIILDTRLECHPSLRIFKTLEKGPVIIVTAASDKERRGIFEDMGVELIDVRTNKHGFISLSQLMKKLGKRSISSVLVEGGAAIFSSFLRERITDEIILICAPVLFGEGVDTLDKDYLMHMPPVRLRNISRRMIGDDIMIRGIPDIK